MRRREFIFWVAVILAVFAVFIIAATGVEAQVLRPGGRVAPGATWTPTPTPTATPVPTPTPTPSTAMKCEWVQTPWGGSRCDVSEVCDLVLMPMHVGTAPGITKVQLITEKTTIPRERIAPIESGAMRAEIEYGEMLKWAEWYVRAEDAEYSDTPVLGCYCDEKQNVVVTCAIGEVVGVE